MIKRAAILFFLLVMPFASAVEFNINSEYSKGETMIANFSGNFISSVTESNILFYRDHVRIPLESKIVKINDYYYLYAQLPELESNYSVRIEGAKYMKGSVVTEDDIIRNFTITNQTADFSVNPGAFVTSGNFEMNIQNLNDVEINITVMFESDDGSFNSNLLGTFEDGDEKSLKIISGEVKELSFEASGVSADSLKILNIYTEGTVYKIPVFVLTNSVSNKEERDMRFDSKELRVVIPTGENVTKVITLQNIGKSSLENVQITFSDELKPYLTLPVSSLDSLGSDQQKEIGLYFTSSVDEKVIEGQIKAESSGTYAYTAITLIYLRDAEDDESLGGKTVIQTCSEMSGKICSSGEQCSIENVYATDGLCCKEYCNKQSQPVSFWKYLGWILLIAVIVFIAWFVLKKYRKVKPVIPNNFPRMK